MFIPVVLELREKHTLVDNPDVNQAYPVLEDDPGPDTTQGGFG